MAAGSQQLITFPDALRAFPDVPRETLDTWRRRCPYVKRHKLWWRIQAGPQTDGRQRKRVCVLRRRELEQVVAAYRRREKKPPPYGRRGKNLVQHDGRAGREFWESRKVQKDADGSEWVLLSEACRLIGVNNPALLRWVRSGCPFLDGARPRSRPDSLARAGVRVYARE